MISGEDIRPSDAEIQEKNRIYDRASGRLWELSVYRPVHGGWEFTNMGGAPLLDDIMRRCGLGPNDDVLELGSGTGAVCRYLTTSCGCRITGLEVNASQISYARSSVNRLPSATQQRIRFLHTDVLRWVPDRRYRLVLAIDTITLLADARQALGCAWKALQPDGFLAFADMLAGPALSRETRRRVWDYDGIRPLPTPAATARLLAEAGFEDIRLVDITHVAASCFHTIRAALESEAATIIEAAGPREHSVWTESAEYYANIFESGQIGYWECLARNPLSPNGAVSENG